MQKCLEFIVSKKIYVGKMYLVCQSASMKEVIWIEMF